MNERFKRNTKSKNKEFDFKTVINEQLRQMNKPKADSKVSMLPFIQYLNSTIGRFEDKVNELHLNESLKKDSDTTLLLKEFINLMHEYRDRFKKL